MKNPFNKISEGDKILESILEDIEKSPQSYQKLSGDAYLYKGDEKWWGYVQMKSEVLTIRERNVRTKVRNLHYDVTPKISKKFFEYYETH